MPPTRGSRHHPAARQDPRGPGGDRALEALKDIAARHGKLFSVNDRADVALLTDADVFHVGQGDLTSGQARAVLGPDVILGRSTHSLEQALAAEADLETDYFCVGPVWETRRNPVGLPWGQRC